MTKHSIKSELEAIVEVVRGVPEGVSLSEIEAILGVKLPQRTLQSRLKRLVEEGRLLRAGERRWARYRAPDLVAEGTGRVASTSDESDQLVPISPGGREIQKYLRRPEGLRKPVGYDRSFLEGYCPNDTFYLDEEELKELHRIGKPEIGEQPAGTYARQLLDRLLIELSWSSSRLEGNTYTLLDTRRLLAFSQEAEGKEAFESQMILNHKDAIEFLVSSAEEVGFNRYSILNLHAMLANNLLPDPAASGRLRQIPVGIQGSVFHPLEVPSIIGECFDQLLSSAGAISDPYEQALFIMVQLPYLQPFDDVNKRVSRLAANIPLIKENLCPLSYSDVPIGTYSQAMLGVYELRRVDLLKDVFLWAYHRSAERYVAIRQSLGEPNPFRLCFREEIREIVAKVVRERMGKRDAFGHMRSWTKKNIPAPSREQFLEVVEAELLSLHEGNFARYQIRPSEYESWRRSWK